MEMHSISGSCLSVCDLFILFVCLFFMCSNLIYYVYMCRESAIICVITVFTKFAYSLSVVFAESAVHFSTIQIFSPYNNVKHNCTAISLLWTGHYT